MEDFNDKSDQKEFDFEDFIKESKSLLSNMQYLMICLP